ncbi:lysophospholipid acyltransferase family protein [Marinobacter sp. ANT_B65]|uniref:lysophospholipid acyltransferase family protein n=1 Tax=Marinobacter sp. ANT_B65 TaxID=2039467 RepID=UPI000BBE5A10|nr:lysophospholipid acyltransferase family protein [Marinobacter sp. ANT_B65]PCM44011.1 lipid A biosynthesis acyltransferase [Marinobacter sp. ANT_B65]
MSRFSKKHKLPLWHPRLWPSWALVFTLYLLSFLPMSSKQKLGKTLGRFLNRKLKSRARVADRNLAICFPDLDKEARAKLVQDNFIACTRGFLESIHAWWRDMSPYYKATEVQGLEHLEEARSKGRGVLLIGGHYSIFDFALPLVACHLKNPGYVYRPNNNPVIDRMIENGRRRHFGIRPFTKRELRPMVSFLKKGGEVWFACDQDFGKKTELFVPFFGVETGCITSPSYIAKVSGAAVVCVSHLRMPDGRYRVVFSPVQAGFGADKHNDTQVWNRYIEEAIREQPDQYLWLHKRFKTRPEGVEKVY